MIDQENCSIVHAVCCPEKKAPHSDFSSSRRVPTVGLSYDVCSRNYKLSAEKKNKSPRGGG